MIDVLKRFLPKFIFNLIRDKYRYNRLKKSYMYDLNHYYEYSMSKENISKQKLISKIILDTHVIEKGLTMPDTRLGFGYERLIVLIKNIIGYIKRYNCNEFQLLHGISVVDEYFNFHKEKEFDVSKQVVDNYNNLLKVIDEKSIEFTSRKQINISKEEYFSNAKSSFFEFSESRSSIRNYSESKIDIDRVLMSLDLCRNTPSACNRQAVRVHLYTNRDKIQDILKLQGGNRGFGHLSSFLIIVTYEPSVYFEESERSSGFVDGGMYAMNILYALHANLFAACILNTAHNPNKDKIVREETNIPKSECFVAMIAGGIPPEEFKIAKSLRYPLKDILTKH